MKLHTGDTVLVISGKDKGKVSRILRVLHDQDRVVVADANLRTRHIKKTPQSPGRKVRYEASIHVSNVALVDPKTKKPTRVGYRFVGGKKERFAKRSGEALVSGAKLRKMAGENIEGSKSSKGDTSTTSQTSITSSTS